MKSYIGSSINIARRLYAHRKLLTDNRHWISYFQNSWNKYGESNFEFYVNSLTRMFKCGTATINRIKNNKILAYKKVA